MSGGSNVTGWLPDLRAIAAAARQRGVLVVVDGAQLVPHRPVDITALGIDVIAFSGHKMYAPFGAGALIAPRALLAEGEPFLVGGGAVGAVSFDDVIWADGPDRDDAGSPNVLGVVALTAAADELRTDGWSSVLAHEEHLLRALDSELASVPGLHRLGPVTGTGCRSPPSTSTAYPTGCWLPASPTSTPSAPGAAASVPTPTWAGCSDSPTTTSRSSMPMSAPAPGTGFPARSG